MTNKVHYLFWTGGYDSSFRLLMLSREPVTIQPVYVQDDNRRSIKYELKAMDTILTILKRKKLKATILPLVVIKLNDVTVDFEITQAYRNLTKKMKLGAQYEWLAQVANEYPNIELGVEKHFDAFGGCSTAIKTYGAFKERDGWGGVWIVDKEKSSNDINILFGNFSFPILDYTEIDMLKLIHEWEYDDIIKNAWFCHRPIGGKPCGMCRPCQQKMADKVEFLFDSSACKRYKIFEKSKKLFGEYVANKIAYLIQILSNLG